jgi:hypothetical protein
MRTPLSRERARTGIKGDHTPSGQGRAPGPGWVQVPGGGWVPPDHPLAKDGTPPAGDDRRGCDPHERKGRRNSDGLFLVRTFCELAWCHALTIHFTVSSERIRASVQVMSTLSPTFTFASAALSCTRVLYFQLFGPVNVIDGSVGSIAVIVAVIVR